MTNDLLTFELTKDGDEIEIHADRKGLQNLIEVVSGVLETALHNHLMTAAWGGSELTEDKQSETNTLINKVTIRLWE